MKFEFRTIYIVGAVLMCKMKLFIRSLKAPKYEFWNTDNFLMIFGVVYMHYYAIVHQKTKICI